jgi:hypothetical protein
MLRNLSVAQAEQAWIDAVVPWNEALKSGRKPSRRVVQKVFRQTELVLRAYHHPANWINGAPKEHLPRNFVHAIADQVSYIASGHLPEPIRDATSPNRSSAGPLENRDIMAAMLYIDAARKNIVQDPSAIGTIVSEFGVDRRSVFRWKRKYKNLSLEEGLRYISEAEAPAHIRNEMRKAGKRYQMAGRSSSAIASRNSKR